MSEKGLLVDISDMQRKQGQQAEKLDETNNKLQQLFEISIQQFEERQKFREQPHQQNKQFNPHFKNKMSLMDCLWLNLKSKTHLMIGF